MSKLPLSDIRVIEFAHAVMGPSCGVILADLGAEVIHVEPTKGDDTRRLRGFGSGYFTYFNRNKKSLAIDIKSTEGKEIIFSLLKKSDVLIENFGPQTMDRIGYGYSVVQEVNPRLIYCSLKGFLKGPYEHRPAMDEVVQIMGGLAYMTGPSGRPLRAGTSIVDITGGMFGVIGILSALRERDQTGKGTFVRSALFETTAFLMGQHMAHSSISGGPIPPMPERVSAWSIYQTFESSDGEPVFIGIISDRHWQRFCTCFDRLDLLSDERLGTNNQRISEKQWLIPEVSQTLSKFSKVEIIARCEESGIPFAPVARPEDLFEDPHLNAAEMLMKTKLPSGEYAKLPRLPIEMEDCQFGLRSQPPEIGEDTGSILSECGIKSEEVKSLIEKGIVTVPKK